MRLIDPHWVYSESLKDENRRSTLDRTIQICQAAVQKTHTPNEAKEYTGTIPFAQRYNKRNRAQKALYEASSGKIIQ